MSDITPINPSAGLPDEDPLENLLDEESDGDFGYVVTRDRATGPDGHPVKLADWSAQDFASIYTRFRPHLERHARRFLNNPSQVDEVVQDAFLYLMVSLPELDSEIGVLRFLKWKTRLLCLDVIRASGKAYVANIDDVAEPMSSDPEVSTNLEQQDDAAVLRLALSKLNPRHREVLLASIYEEKSTDQIAAQVGLSENATRQLIFRARSAFKKALLGDEVNTDGMSAAAILSVAARKAAQESKKVGAQAMVFVLFLMLAIGAFVNFTGRGNQTQQLSQSKRPVVSIPDTTSTLARPPVLSLQEVGMKEILQSKLDLVKMSQGDLSRIFDVTPSAVSVIRTAVRSDNQTPMVNFRVVSSQGVIAEFDFDPLSESLISNVLFKFDIGGQEFRAYPKQSELFKVQDLDGLWHIIYYGSLEYIFDEEGKIRQESELSKSAARLELVLEQSNDVQQASLVVIPN